MKLVAGLGNPGRSYASTRHNIGFLVVDEAGQRLSCSLRRSLRFRARMGRAELGSETLVLLKPLCYMNRSGAVIAAVARSRGLRPEDLIVVMDDADMEVGRVRVRASGSSGGHRGLESVIRCVGSEKFVRVRLGIGRDLQGRPLIEHVLSRFQEQELIRVRQAVRIAAEAVLCVVGSGVEEAMNRFNASR